MTGAAPTPPSTSPAPAPRRLDSWKEIAAYLRRTVRTVQRWEREQGLPVRRLHHNRLASVYAFTHELDEWWEQRRSALDAADGDEDDQVAPPPAPPDSAWRTRRGMIALGLMVTIAATLWAAATIRQQRRTQESVRLYEAGRVLWTQRTPAGFEQARQAFEQAIALDPTNARAHAGLADTHTLLEAFGIVAASAALPKALAAAERAIALDPELGEAYASLSLVLWQKNQRPEAIQAAERAIALDPGYATARHWYALYLQDSGRYEEAVEEGRKAMALAPDSAVIGADVTIMLRNAGRRHEARALLEDLVLRHPASASLRSQLSDAYRREGRFDQALEQQTHVVRLGDTRPAALARLAWLQGRNGLARGAADLARRLRTMNEQGEHVPPHVMVEALIGAGDLDSASRLVARGIDEEASWVSLILLNDDSGDVFRPLVEDRRWRPLEAGARAIADRVVRDTVATRPARDLEATPRPAPAGPASRLQ